MKKIKSEAQNIQTTPEPNRENNKNNITMKRFLFCLMAALAFVGCTDEGPDDGGSNQPQPQTTITLTTTALNFTTEGGSQNVTFTSSGEWTAQVLNDRANDWCKLTPASGAAGNGQITVTAAANATTDERSASIILKSGTVQKTIKVTQKQKDALTVTASKFEVAAEGGTVTIEVKANVDFSYAVDGASQSWIKYQTTRAMKTSTLVFDIAENDSRDKRQGTVTISSGALKEVVTIYQEDAKPTIVISKSEYVIGSEGGSVAVEVKSNVDVSVELPSDVEWLSESTTRAMSTNTYYFDVAENTGYDQRSATIVFTNKADNLTEEVTITQAQKDAIVLAKSEYEIGADGGALDFEIQTNVDVTVKTSATWIKQVMTRALESKMLFFDIAANDAQEAREGTITLSGGAATQTITVKQKGAQDILDAERQALIDLYNATGGDNWKNNENWCSDKPVSEWYGVTCGNMVSNYGQVTSIYLDYNNLVGTIPESICNLTALNRLCLRGNKLTSIPESIGGMSTLKWLWLTSNALTAIPESICNMTSLEQLCLEYNKLTGSIPEAIGNMTSLECLQLSSNQLSGSIPASLGNLSKLSILRLDNNKLTGSIPKSFGNLTSLTELEMHSNQLTGSIPEGFGNMGSLKRLVLYSNKLTGSIPESFGNMKSLQRLYLQNNQLTGSIPESIGGMESLKELDLQYNQLTGSVSQGLANCSQLYHIILANNGLSGSIPEAVTKTTWWSHYWGYIIPQDVSKGGGFEEEGLIIPAPQFSETDVDGNTITSAIYAENEYTILFNFLTSCGYAKIFAPTLVEIYNTYKDRGVGIFAISCSTTSEIKAFAQEYGFTWPIINTWDTPIRAFTSFELWSPIACVIDKNGMVVFNHIYNDYTELADFFADKFGEDEAYESTDYSQDGVVTTLQTATKGAGIDVVLMGDAYSDRQIADGTYDKTMNTAMEKFFAVEPYKSYRDHFNVYSVKAVSKNEGYGDGYETIFSGEFGEGTLVSGDHSKVIEYGLKAIGDERMNEAMLVVMMNSSAYAGTCYMYHPSATGDAGSGLSISYFPIGVDDTALEQVLNHETNGHGFAKLADEYAYESMGAIPSEEVTNTQTQQTNWGWWKNVDFTSDVTAVRWAKFIADSRYANEKLGAYEGAMTYWTGVWRPTENSIMRYNTGGFNAPSREAIYYRIHRLAYGDEWTYDYETFVEYDEINRTTTTTTQSVPMIYKPTAPPVVMQKNWRDELR